MGQQSFPCAAVAFTPPSRANHQLVIAGRDDIRARTILTLVAQRSAAIREEKF
jgi:hypothetical protein